MISINVILEEFLNEQRQRLKLKTFRDYESVVSLFKIYLNDYAHNYLGEADLECWEKEIEEDMESFTRIFGAKQLSNGVFCEFLDYFIIRKVMSGEDFMKKAVRVMKKLVKWLYDNQYIHQAVYAEMKEYFSEASNLPTAEKVSDLIYEETKKSPRVMYEEEEEGYFYIDHVESGELWLQPMFDGNNLIGPFSVSKKITDLCEEGWQLSGLVGKSKGKWYFIESGNVYR